VQKLWYACHSFLFSGISWKRSVSGWISLERYLFWENLAENIEEAHLIEEV
jgi:hypothetical protein